MIFIPQDIQSRLRQQPFTPLRVVTTTGQNYDINHPEMVIVAQRFIFIGLPSVEDPSVADQVTRVPLLHVAEMRDLPGVSPSSTTNGPAS